MNAPAEATPSASRQRRRRGATAPSLASVLIALLSVQFLLGTYLVLYVSFPAGGNLGALWLGGLVVLILHIIVGIMVIGTAGRLTYVASRAHNGRQTALAATAALGMVIAFLAGAAFTFGEQADAMSFVMAFGFFLGMFGSALILAGAHLPGPDAGGDSAPASR